MYKTNYNIKSRPINECEYREFYDLEMINFSKDQDFYINNLNSELHILELGCGSGRLTRILQKTGIKTVGIDISHEMLKECVKSINSSYICMDINHISFNAKFDAVLIPYNTLNLLENRQNITNCLNNIKAYLKPNGKLLMEVFVANKKLQELNNKNSLQIQVFENNKGTNIYKETTKLFSKHKESMLFEESYKVRPFKKPEEFVDLHNEMQCFVTSAHKLKELIRCSGFKIVDQFGSYNLLPFNPEVDHRLLLNCVVTR